MVRQRSGIVGGHRGKRGGKESPSKQLSLGGRNESKKYSSSAKQLDDRASAMEGKEIK